ncbi:MAG: hypothetical protein D6719_05060 [Candidatus Dadabacteria bacterium]|nr:MAG: hypothetical protein D6719_05060 [Candidatus Dadabacteria bacterium]
MLEFYIAELEQGSKATAKLLELLPEDKFGWKPHEKSLSLGQLAHHIAPSLPACCQFLRLIPLK